jgi:hypothetical protein
MELITILNRCPRFRGFVLDGAEECPMKDPYQRPGRWPGELGEFRQMTERPHRSLSDLLASH